MKYHLKAVEVNFPLADAQGGSRPTFDTFRTDVLYEVRPGIENHLQIRLPAELVNGFILRKEHADPRLANLAPGRIVRLLRISKDATVDESAPKSVGGSVTRLHARQQGIYSKPAANAKRALFGWPGLKVEDVGSSTRQVFLGLYCLPSPRGSRTAKVEVHELLGEWPEDVAWETQPAAAKEVGASFELRDRRGWVLVDITSLVRSQFRANRPQLGVVLQMEDEQYSEARGGGMLFQEIASREDSEFSEANHPFLLIVDPPDSAPATATQRPEPSTGEIAPRPPEPR